MYVRAFSNKRPHYPDRGRVLWEDGSSSCFHSSSSYGPVSSHRLLPTSFPMTVSVHCTALEENKSPNWLQPNVWRDQRRRTRTITLIRMAKYGPESMWGENMAVLKHIFPMWFRHRSVWVRLWFIAQVADTMLQCAPMKVTLHYHRLFGEVPNIETISSPCL